MTDADHRAERIILADLAAAFPDIPVVAEEEVAAGRVPDIAGKRFFLVDPLDGTKEFVERNSHFTVNIGLVENGAPVVGVVYAPALGLIYSAAAGMAKKAVVEDGQVTGEWTTIGCRRCGDRPMALTSRWHNSPETISFLTDQGISDHEAVGSSLKFCLLAEGIADIYPRFSRTMEWDTAAGDAILRSAGGETLTMGAIRLATASAINRMTATSPIPGSSRAAGRDPQPRSHVSRRGGRGDEAAERSLAEGFVDPRDIAKMAGQRQRFPVAAGEAEAYTPCHQRIGNGKARVIPQVDVENCEIVRMIRDEFHRL